MTMNKTFSKGLVSVTQWNNVKKVEGKEDQEYQTFTIQKSYKDSAGAWQNTNSLNESDLDRLIDILTQIKLQKVSERGQTQ